MSRSYSATRRPETVGPTPGCDGWRALDDDELLNKIESLPADHDRDDELLAVVRSQRHFFVRQEAARKVTDGDRLKAWASDRRIGQVLSRQMTRAADATYLEMVLRNSRYVDVRQAASAQLSLVRAERARQGLPADVTDGSPPR
jgi:hypothetical protein